MKQLLLAVCVLTCATNLFGQGTIVFNNRVAGDVVAPIYGPNPANIYLELHGNSSIGYPVGNTVYGGALLEGSRYSVGLWAAAGANQPETALQLVAGSVVPFRTGAAAGFIQAPTAGLVIPGTAAGSVATLQVRAWDTLGIGATWDDTSGPKGQSSLFNSAPLGGGPIPPCNLTGMESFNAYVMIPEPSSLVLVGISAAALLVLRRQK